ncbi:MAG: dUTP diphosphatase [Ruminococcaceae bacterium]|nr:dUTP diphosphatase [Oscillospiraceae bacterium]
MKHQIRVQILREGAVLPSYGSALAAGADLCACLPEAVTIAPGKTLMIPTGLAMEIPEGYAGLIYARSGLACKRDLAPANKVGVIDADYRGEIIVALHNHGEVPQTVAPGDRIAQLVIAACPQADFLLTERLSGTKRGEGGFGSTGK